MLCALIMAGGKGTRFWPLSTEEKPKQFLKLLGEDTMIQMTVKRLVPLIPIEKIFVVTDKKYIDLVREQLPQLLAENIIAEPMGKNTAPCIALSAFHISKIYEDATIAVLPSDHLIQEENKFLDILTYADNFVNINKEAIVTIGIKPNRPEIGYGYIRYNKFNLETKEIGIKKVAAFVEKPHLEKAKAYIEAGNYLWNGGMFIWKADHILRLTKRHLKDTFQVLSEIAATCEEDYVSVLEVRYKEVDSVSVDYGIMEKTDNIYVITGELGWDDVGSWNAIERYTDKDEFNNVCLGNVKNIQANNNIVISSSKPIVIDGIHNIFVVESDGMIFIGKKEEMENIRELKTKI